MTQTSTAVRENLNSVATDDVVDGQPSSSVAPESPTVPTDVGWAEVVNGDRSNQSRLAHIHGRHGQWTCFLCCHVRTGTIAIGLWHIVLHLLALSLIAVVVVHPEMLLEDSKHRINEVRLFTKPLDVQSVNCTRMPCLLATQGNQGNSDDFVGEFPMVLQNLIATHRLNSEDVNVGLFITLCLFVVTLLLVYGAFKRQPVHLMPFFLLQVFDFCISSMTMIGYLSYLPNVRQLIKDTPTFPFQRQLLLMNTNCLTLFVMLIFITTFMVKGYCISIVWRCYKYLMIRNQGGFPSLGPVDQESQTLVLGQDLPDYNSAVTDPQYRKKLSGLFPDPPPSYDMAMATLYAQAVETPQPTSSSDPTSMPLLHHPSRSTAQTNNDASTTQQGV